LGSQFYLPLIYSLVQLTSATEFVLSFLIGFDRVTFQISNSVQVPGSHHFSSVK
jgi:hypothetical protein